jgi:hypothetical protein
MTTENEIDITAESIIEVNPDGILQVDADNWGILFNPATDASFAINPMSIFIWNQLKDRMTVKEIHTKLTEHFSSLPENVEEEISGFITRLWEIGLAKVENN